MFVLDLAGPGVLSGGDARDMLGASTSPAGLKVGGGRGRAVQHPTFQILHLVGILSLRSSPRTRALLFFQFCR